MEKIKAIIKTIDNNTTCISRLLKCINELHDALSILDLKYLEMDEKIKLLESKK